MNTTSFWLPTTRAERSPSRKPLPAGWSGGVRSAALTPGRRFALRRSSLVPHSHAQPPHGRHHGDLLVFRISLDEPLVGGMVAALLANSRPHGLAQRSPHARRTVSRDVPFAIAGCPTLIATRDQSQVSTDLTPVGKVCQISHLGQKDQRRQLSDALHF